MEILKQIKIYKKEIVNHNNELRKYKAMPKDDDIRMKMRYHYGKTFELNRRIKTLRLTLWSQAQLITRRHDGS